MLLQIFNEIQTSPDKAVLPVAPDAPVPEYSSEVGTSALPAGQAGNIEKAILQETRIRQLEKSLQAEEEATAEVQAAYSILLQQFEALADEMDAEMDARQMTPGAFIRSPTDDWNQVMTPINTPR